MVKWWVFQSLKPLELQVRPSKPYTLPTLMFYSNKTIATQTLIGINATSTTSDKKLVEVIKY